MSQEERTGWRDARISARHREWGYDVPAVDVDFLVCEYDRKIPVAVVDYKRRDQFSPDTNTEVLGMLGTMAGLPSLVVLYGSDLEWYQPIAINHLGKVALSNLFPDRFQIDRTPRMSEPTFKATLYALRWRFDEARKLCPHIVVPVGTGLYPPIIQPAGDNR